MAWSRARRRVRVRRSTTKKSLSCCATCSTRAASALFAEPNPAPLKAVLARLGMMGAAVRAPLTAASDAVRDAACGAHAGVPEALQHLAA